MALESGNFIGDLVITNPDGADQASTLDDHARLIKSLIKNSFAGFTGGVIVCGTDAGAVNAYVLNPSTPLPSLASGMLAVIKVTNANTGASTLNISSLGAKSIVTCAGAALTSGDLAANRYYWMVYDGTNFQLLNPTKNYSDQLAFNSALPAQSGNAGKILKTDGINASWVRGGELVLLSTYTVSSPVSLISFLSAFSSTYDDYIVVFDGISFAAADNPTIRLGQSGVADSGSHYNFVGVTTHGNGLAVNSSGTTTTEWALGYQNLSPGDTKASFMLTFQDVNGTPFVYGRVALLNGGTLYVTDPVLSYSNGAISGFELYGNGGNNIKTGSVRVYGVTKS